MDGLKAAAGFVFVLSLVFAVMFAIYVFSWLVRILGFLIALFIAALFIGYVGWSTMVHYKDKFLGEKDEGS